VHASAFAMTPTAQALTRVRAALLTHPPAAVASHGSAARVLGAPVPAEPLEHVTVSHEDQRRRRLGVRCHLAELDRHEVQVVEGIRITAPHRLFLDLASCLGLIDLVVLGDWLVSRGLVTTDSLAAYCSRASTRGAARARRAAAYVRDRVDSPMETRLRLLLVLAGLPEPEVNRELRDERGRLLLRLDLSWRELKVAVEYDGRHHLTSTPQWERDVERRNDLTASGWLLITVTAAGIYRSPEDTVRRVHEALLSRGCRRLRLADGWRAHFAA
jgi:very-short-patch-repair endonuclease